MDAKDGTVSRRGTKAAEESVPAGVFSEWLARFEASLRGTVGNDVPCGDCIGCCSSSYFVHVAPDDVDALRAIPADLRFEAPGMSPGHTLLGYDGKGFCPMMKARSCTIYEDRPGTCRTFDCRVFAAAGIPAGGPEKDGVNRRVRRWRFEYPSPRDRASHQAVRDAARFISTRADAFPGGRAPDNPSHIAILAIRCRNLFLDGADAGRPATETAIEIAAIGRAASAGC